MESTLVPIPRIFVDSSVLMPAVLSATGSAHDLVRLGSEGQVILVISSVVLAEVERNLRRKAPTRLPDFHRILGSCQFEVVEPSREAIVREAENVEPKDAAIVVAAIAGNAQFLVTYDVKHLLGRATQIEALHGIVVCSPAVAIASLVGSQ